MTMPLHQPASARVPAQMDPCAPGVLARSTYQELCAAGLSEEDIMAFAGELLSLVATGVRERRESA